MSKQNLVSAAIAAETKSDILAKVAVIKGKLGFLLICRLIIKSDLWAIQKPKVSRTQQKLPRTQGWANLFTEKQLSIKILFNCF